MYLNPVLFSFITLSFSLLSVFHRTLYPFSTAPLRPFYRTRSMHGRSKAEEGPKGGRRDSQQNLNCKGFHEIGLHKTLIYIINKNS